MVAGNEGRPAARSRIAKPRKNNSPSAAIRISKRSAKATATPKAAPPVAAITATSTAAWTGRGGPGMPTRICAASTAVSPSNGSPALVPQTNARVVASARRRTARCRVPSGDIGHHRDKPDPKPGQRVRNRIVARVEDDAGARIVAHALGRSAGGLERQLHREALRRREPTAAALASFRKAGRRIHIALAHTPAHALHPRWQHAAGQYLEHYFGPRAGLDVLQAILTQKGL